MGKSAVTAQRNGALDFLRAVAVLLVLGAHVHLPPPGSNPVLLALASAWRRGGWVGVDLFFVLSGFLISGLLFREYEQHRRIDLRRFFARRALKIYPAFYVLLAVTIVMRFLRGEPLPRRAIFNEALFIQNYGGATLWGHTWFLAVEEHFYILLPICLVLLIRWRAREEHPFRGLPAYFAAVAVLALSFRLLNAWLGWSDLDRNYYQTHCRIDSLLFGVLLSYWFHFSPDAFRAFSERWRGSLWLLGIGLLAPAFLIDAQSYHYTVGLTCCYVGSGMILAATLRHSLSKGILAKTMTTIGAASYCIYLWHIAIRNWVIPLLERYLGDLVGCYGLLALYVIVSVLFGIAFARLIEYPILYLRDKLFPSRTKSLQVQAAKP